MVKKKDSFWICEECLMKYMEREWAEKCEAWCREYHSCNIEIIKHAVHDDFLRPG